MNKFTTFIRLFATFIVGAGSIGTCVGISNAYAADNVIEADAIGADSRYPQMIITVSGSGNFRPSLNKVEKARAHFFDIRTVFDNPEDVQISNVAYENDKVRQVLFKNTDNWEEIRLYAWKSSDDKQHNADWPGAYMNQIADDGTFSLDVNKEYDRMIICNGKNPDGNKTMNLNFNGYSIYTSTIKGWNGGTNVWHKNDLKHVTTNNSRYFWETSEDTYSNVDGHGWFHDEITGKVTSSALISNAITFPWYVTSVTMHVVAECAGKVITAKNNVTFVRDPEIGSNFTYTIGAANENDSPFNNDGKFTAGQHINGKYCPTSTTKGLDKFLYAYSKAFTHSTDNKYSDSVCGSYNTNNEANIRNAIEAYKALSADNKTLIDTVSLDKYDANGNKETMGQVMQYAMRLYDNSILSSNLKNAITSDNTLMIILALCPIAIISVVAFLLMHKHKKYN